MRRAELRDELERLGSRPVPLPDPRRVDAIEVRLYQDFVVAPAPSAAAALLVARRRRRLVMVGGLGAAAAATFVAVVLHRGSTPGFELQAASGAVALFPDGDSRPIHAGDQIPPGGLIQTGPSGAVTIDGTKIGPDQVVLLSEEGLTLLPSHSPSDHAATDVTPAPTSVAPPASTAATEVTAPAEASLATSPATVADPAPSSPVVPPADPAAATTMPETTAAPAPALFTQPIDHLALTVGEETGGVNLAWTTSDAADFGRYVIARGTAADHQLSDLAELGDRQITSFTDPAAPHGVALMYQVVAMSEDGRPLAASDVVELTLQDGSASSAPTTDAPPTSDGSGSGLTVPPTTGQGSTSVPGTTAPDTTVPTTGEPATTAGATSTTAPTSAPSTTTATTSGRPNGPSTTTVPSITGASSTPPGTEPVSSGPPTATTRPGG
jgi:S-DNA-T family DNA segregation ATPase FtsK/SpoIIIE